MWSLFYTDNDDSSAIHRCGPWTTPEQALNYACENDESLVRQGRDSEFNVERDRVYLVSPEHKTYELELTDLEAFQIHQKTTLYVFLDRQ